MLQRLTIKGFQAHKHTTIELGYPVVSIVGPTDAGKSAILRALRWVALNKPGGDAFIRWGMDGCGVYLHTDEATIARMRSRKGRNTYGMQVDGDKTEFKAFGAGVPEAIADHLNVDEGNFQGQHDASFWFSDTPGNVAKKLNAIINLDIIDDLLGGLGGRVKAHKAKKEATEQRLAKHMGHREKLREGVDAADAARALHDLWEVADGLDILVADLTDQIKATQDRQAQADAAGAVAAAGLQIRNNEGRKWRDAQTALDALTKDTREAEKCVMNTLPDAFFAAGEDVMRQHSDWADMAEMTRALGARLVELKTHTKDAKGAADELSSLQKELGDVCPTCGQPVGEA